MNHVVKDTAQFDLRDGRFDCSKLNNICSDGGCLGVNSTILAETIASAECQIELYFMKGCLLVLRGTVQCHYAQLVLHSCL